MDALNCEFSCYFVNSWNIISATAIYENIKDKYNEYTLPLSKVTKLGNVSVLKYHP